MNDKRISRRKFIEAASTAAAGTFLTGCLAQPLPRKAAGDKLQIACIGLGNQMHSLMNEAVTLDQQFVALCDVDSTRMASVRKAFGKHTAKTRTYSDFRQLLDKEKGIDAVLVATPDHWHAAVCKEVIYAGKHVYCEKPLTHTVAEARYIEHLAKRSKVATQTGNQGSASSNFRRSMELIQHGVLGSVHDVHIWHPPHGWPCGIDRPAGEDAIPAGLDWNFWLGPAAIRPYKKEMYHPVNWRGWYDFGGGSLSDFCCHAFSMPVRALDLDYPTRIEATGVGLGLDSFPKSCTVHFYFAARGGRGPVQIHFYTGGDMPDASITAGLAETFNEIPRTGCLVVGTKGTLSAGLWNNECYLKMNGEKEYAPGADHDAAKPVPIYLPRAPRDRHMLEWIEACKGGPKTFSPFEIGGHITEIGAAGLIALRLGRNIDWDGPEMRAEGLPEAAAFVKPQHRQKFGL